MEKSSQAGWGEWVARGVGIVCVVSALLAFFPGWHIVGTLFAKTDAPAWVQAVGSIIGIFVAIAVPAWQRHEEQLRRQREEEEREKARLKEIADVRRTCVHFIASASAALDEISKYIQRDRQRPPVIVLRKCHDRSA